MVGNQEVFLNEAFIKEDAEYYLRGHRLPIQEFQNELLAGNILETTGEGISLWMYTPLKSKNAVDEKFSSAIHKINEHVDNLQQGRKTAADVQEDLLNRIRIARSYYPWCKDRIRDTEALVDSLVASTKIITDSYYAYNVLLFLNKLQPDNHNVVRIYFPDEEMPLEMPVPIPEKMIEPLISYMARYLLFRALVFNKKEVVIDVPLQQVNNFKQLLRNELGKFTNEGDVLTVHFFGHTSESFHVAESKMNEIVECVRNRVCNDQVTNKSASGWPPPGYVSKKLNMKGWEAEIWYVPRQISPRREQDYEILRRCGLCCKIGSRFILVNLLNKFGIEGRLSRTPRPYAKGHFLFHAVEHQGYLPVEMGGGITQLDLERLILLTELLGEKGNSGHISPQGAGAGVPYHTHYHFFPGSPLPICSLGNLEKVSGSKIKRMPDYPAENFVVSAKCPFERLRLSWNIIEQIQKKGISVNICFHQKKIYIFPRKQELWKRSYTNEACRTISFEKQVAGCEVAGRFYANTKEDYDDFEESEYYEDLIKDTVWEKNVLEINCPTH